MKRTDTDAYGRALVWIAYRDDADATDDALGGYPPIEMVSHVFDVDIDRVVSDVLELRAAIGPVVTMRPAKGGAR